MTRTAALLATFSCMSCSATNATPTVTATPPAPTAPSAPASSPPAPPASASTSPDSEIVIESDPSKLKTKKPSVPLKSYDQALKSTTVDADAETLSMKECAAPLSGSIAATCKLQGLATVKLAIRHGKPIGLTVVTEPDQTAVSECMTDHVTVLTWRSVPGMTTCIRTFKVN